MTFKLLITSRSFGTVESESKALLESENIQVDHATASEFDSLIENYDALIIGAHPFPSELMEKCRKLKIICKHGAEIDNIPLAKAKELGIIVTNVPGVNSQRVADLSFGLLLTIARQIAYTNMLVHNGIWQTAVGTDVFGKTLGILGLGAIGKNVALRAEGFSMRVLAYDPYVDTIPANLSFVSLKDLEYVLQNSDFLSLHLPLTEETFKLLTEDRLLQMKRGSYIINTAKGELIDEDALFKVLKSKHLAGAAMDVCTIEPIAPSNPLLSLENVVITPHIGVYSKEAIAMVSLICAKNIVALKKGLPISFVI
ncbi:phosphoglycerate dehydrogenase [Lutispora saccharofermentans]|uniref:Phosphoglycerate dehydrogenase n=1 Tax=Lutispora saccharofermentans TaxID=3024236 RepID=A0ABT1NCL5_9FIRM|nr:phosphoglycerate dehydrogenase [Lutispora saccharofermentans]MCQ1528881.1 phosphoglycerate dehydrogenase [Lutispora saccharofermentans]